MAVLRVPRILCYMITNALGIVAGAAALNALVKARHDRDNAAAYAVSISPFPNLTVSININDILTSGGFLAAGELLLAIIAFFSYACLLVPSVTARTEHHKGLQTLGLASWVFALLWTFGSAIPTTIYGRNRSAKTEAYLAGVALPPATVSALQKATGIDPHYWIHGYTKFLVIAPWPLIFFAILSTILTFIAWSRTDYAAGAGGRHNAGYPHNNDGRANDNLSDDKRGEARMVEDA